MSQELELFDLPVDRTARQEECRVKWIKNKCVGTLEACTGFGSKNKLLNCRSYRGILRIMIGQYR